MVSFELLEDCGDTADSVMVHLGHWSYEALHVFSSTVRTLLDLSYLLLETRTGTALKNSVRRNSDRCGTHQPWRFPMQ
jgi:hypothetical protein